MHAHDSTDTRQETVDLGAELGMEIEEVKKQPPLGLRRKKRPDIGAGRPVPGVANKSRPVIALLPSSYSSQVPGTCSSFPLVVGRSNVAC